jgi:predicted CopG family antitoxin
MPIGGIIGWMVSSNAPTTITVPTFVREALEKYKKKGQSYSDVILEFIEEWPNDDFLREMARRERDEPRLTLSELRKLPGY